MAREKALPKIMTYQEAARRHVDCLHRAAVYDYLLRNLARLLPNDLGDPIETLNATPGCPEPRVSRACVERIFAEIRGTRDATLRVSTRVTKTPITAPDGQARVHAKQRHTA